MAQDKVINNLKEQLKTVKVEANQVFHFKKKLTDQTSETRKIGEMNRYLEEKNKINNGQLVRYKDQISNKWEKEVKRLTEEINKFKNSEKEKFKKDAMSEFKSDANLKNILKEKDYEIKELKKRIIKVRIRQDQNILESGKFDELFRNEIADLNNNIN